MKRAGCVRHMRGRTFAWPRRMRSSSSRRRRCIILSCRSFSSIFSCDDGGWVPGEWANCGATWRRCGVTRCGCSVAVTCLLGELDLLELRLEVREVAVVLQVVVVVRRQLLLEALKSYGEINLRQSNYNR